MSRSIQTASSSRSRRRTAQRTEQDVDANRPAEPAQGDKELSAGAAAPGGERAVLRRGHPIGRHRPCDRACRRGQGRSQHVRSKEQTVCAYLDSRHTQILGRLRAAVDDVEIHPVEHLSPCSMPRLSCSVLPATTGCAFTAAVAEGAGWRAGALRLLRPTAMTSARCSPSSPLPQVLRTRCSSPASFSWSTTAEGSPPRWIGRRHRRSSARGSHRTDRRRHHPRFGLRPADFRRRGEIGYPVLPIPTGP